MNAYVQNSEINCKGNALDKKELKEITSLQRVRKTMQHQHCLGYESFTLKF